MPEGFDVPTMGGKTWFTIDGSLEPIDFAGPSFFRFPEELAGVILERFSKPGDTIFDPFCGFGTTLVAAQALGRVAYGFEHDDDRAAFAASRVKPPTRVIHDDVTNLGRHRLPPVDLVFTSPPYRSFRDWSDEGFAHYWDEFEAIFASFRSLLRSEAMLAVELSNVREEDDRTRPIAFEGAIRLSRLFDFKGELVRCNTGPEEAGPGYDHSYILVFANR